MEEQIKKAFEEYLETVKAQFNSNLNPFDMFRAGYISAIPKPQPEQLLNFLKWIEEDYWDNKGIEDCVDVYLNHRSS